MPSPQVLTGTNASARLKRGFDRLADALAITLGPQRGHILAAKVLGGNPEVIGDAATAARRIVQMPDRAEDVGAMLLRHLVWRMSQRVGDGTATTAVLAQAILDEAHRAKVAGANVQALRAGIDRAARAAVDALQAQARPIDGADDLTLVAYGVTFHPDLSRLLGEMFGQLGADAYIRIEEYLAPYLAGEYVSGGRWKGNLVSPHLMTDTARQRAVLDDCAVVLAAEWLERVEDVQPILELVAQSEAKRVAIIAQKIRGDALAMLVLNHQQGAAEVLAAELTNPETARRADFADLAVLTGATVLGGEVGRGVRGVRREDLGLARQVLADPEQVIVLGDSARAEVVAREADLLRAQWARLPESVEARDSLRQRIARLGGQTATLKVGAYTEPERAAVRQKAERGLLVLPLALREGVVWGGGVAYLNCIEAAQNLALEGDEAWGARIVARALEEPFRRIARNAGLAAPGAVLAEARRRGPEWGYHAEIDEIVSFEEEGIYDAAGVLRHALETAVSGAMTALTVDTLVLHRDPTLSYEP